MLIRTLAVVASTLAGSLVPRAEPPAAGTPGDLNPLANTNPLVHEAVISAPVAEVWRVFTTEEGYKLLGVAHAQIDFRVGGLMRTHYNPKGVIGDDGTIENTILAYEPERVLAFRISKPPKDFPFAESWKHTWSVATFTDLGDGRTNLRLAGLGYTAQEQDQKMRVFFEAGNAWVMKNLQANYDKDVKPAAPGSAHAQDPLAPIVTEVTVRAPREDVWRSISTSAGWKHFLGTESKMELRPGGPFEVYFKADAPAGQRGSEGCTVLSYVPKEMLSFTWNTPPQFAYARTQHTWVVVTLESLGAGSTKVRLQHMGFTEHAAKGHEDEWRGVRAYFVSAWGLVTGELKKHHEGAARNASQ